MLGDPEWNEDPRFNNADARDMVVEIDVPGAGPIRMAGLPLKFTETPGEIRLPPPRLGEHTDSVLHRLGHSAETIHDFAERGVIGLDAPDHATGDD